MPADVPDPPPVQILRTEVVHAGVKFDVVRDHQRLADGSEIAWESTVHRDSVLALPIDADRHVYLVRQYRAQLGQETLEVVGGGVDDDRSPDQAMRRELAEEAGIEADLISLGSAELGAATVRCRQHFFLAVVRRVGPARLEPFERLTVRGIERLPLEHAVDLVMDGTVRDVSSRTVILMAAEYVRRHGLSGC